MRHRRQDAFNYGCLLKILNYYLMIRFHAIAYFVAFCLEFLNLFFFFSSSTLAQNISIFRLNYFFQGNVIVVVILWVHRVVVIIKARKFMKKKK